MDNQDIIEQISEQLSDVITLAADLLGKDVTLALLIHYLHEVSFESESREAA